MSWPGESRILATRDQVSCNLAGESVILNLNNGVYYGLDPVGARVWTLVQEPRTLVELRDALLHEYEVDASSLEADLRDLLHQLAEQGLINLAV